MKVKARGLRGRWLGIALQGRVRWAGKDFMIEAFFNNTPIVSIHAHSYCARNFGLLHYQKALEYMMR